MAKAPKLRQRKLYYRRAEWSEMDHSQHTLEDILKDAHEQNENVSSRIFPGLSGSEVKGASYIYDEKGIFIQIASYTPGQETSTIENSREAPESNVTPQEAPDGKDFLDGEVFALVKDNHVIFCPSGARESTADYYFKEMINKSDHVDITHTLELDKIAKASKVSMLEKEGVKGIELDCSLYEASLMHIKEKEKDVSGIMSKIAGELKSIFDNDPTLKEIEEKENLNIKLSVTYDGREALRNYKDTDFGVRGKERLKKTSSKLLRDIDEDNDGFTIITGRGNKITASEIRIAETKKIKTLGKSICKVDARVQMHAYYEELKNTGVLQQ